jgi:hypothetical protein
MVENFLKANSKCDEYKCFEYDILLKYHEIVCECFHMDTVQVVKHMSDNGCNFETVCLKFGDYYLFAYQDKIGCLPRMLPIVERHPETLETLPTHMWELVLALVHDHTAGCTTVAPHAANICNNSGCTRHRACDCPNWWL